MHNEWKDIKIFISSTFNDMHAERDYLVKNVFPELAEWCEQRRLRLIDIDLRWGITTADAEANDTVRKCLNGIDESRPFFLCFLGQRRGWVPNDPLRLSYENRRRAEKGAPVIETEINDETTSEYKRVGSLSGKTSVTEMEIEHALLAPMIRLAGDREIPSEKDRHALFFFRENPFDETLGALHRNLFLNDAVSEYGDDPERVTGELEKFKHKIRSRFGSEVIDYACVFKRDGTSTPELRIPGLEGEEKKRNEALCKGRLTDFSIRRACLNAKIADRLKQEYPNLSSGESVALKYVVLAGLMAKITDEYPDRTFSLIGRSNRYEQDREQQELFIRKTSEGFIPVPEICDKLDHYIFDNERRPLMLTAEAGLGKSTVLAHCATAWREEARLSKSRFLIRFCGVSDMASTVYDLWNSICRQAGIEPPASLDELRRRFLQLITELSQRQYERTVVVIDAVNQMQGGTDMLDWLPEQLPEGVKLIVSIKQDDDTKAQTARSKCYTVHAEAIRNDAKGIAQKEKLISEYLKRNLKALDRSHIRTICANKASGNPLFLKILLSELRVFGSFRQLDEEISRYGDTPQKAFKQVLERLENDVACGIAAPRMFVSFLFGLMAHARKGLSEKEMIRCFEKVFPPELNKTTTGAMRFFLRQVRPFFTRHNGRFDFLYDTFKEAAKEKYGSIVVNGITVKESGWHDCLAQSLYHSRPGECARHARKADNRTFLTSIYTDTDFLNRYYRSEGAYALNAEAHSAPAGVIPDEIMRFIDDTAVLLEKHPEMAPETFYKELSSGFKAAAGKLCAAPWIRMDKLDTGMDENHAIESVKPASMQMEDIYCGGIAGNSREAFLLSAQNTVKIIRPDSLQTISTFTLPTADSPVEKLFCDADGHLLIAVMRERFSVYELQRDRAGGVLACRLCATENCRRLRFTGTLAFAGANRFVYQTPENEVKAFSLRHPSAEQSLGMSENALAGYFEEQQEYLLYKTPDGYRLTRPDSAEALPLDSSVNDMIRFNDKLFILPNDRYLLVCDPSGLYIETRIALDFVPGSAVLFNGGILISDEHGAIYTWHPREGITSHGMLAVEWDRNPKLFQAEINRAFYFSNNRYALLASVQSSESQIMQAAVNNGKAEMLLVHGNNDPVFQKDGVRVKLTNPFRGNLYGVTSLLNYRCAWNPDGDILSMGDGKTAVLDLAGGTQKHIAEPDPLAVIISIHWVNGMDAFVILYNTGDIHIVKANGRHITKVRVFQSSTGNYLACDCGNCFCVLTKRRLVRATTVFEEEALAVLDKNGRLLYEDHFRGTGRPTFKDVVYDSTQKNLYLISDTAAHVLSIPDKFVAKDISFDAPLLRKPVGIAAKDGTLYYASPEGDVCTADLYSGKPGASLPLHRNVSGLQPSDAGRQVVLVENNERVYTIQINY